MILACFADTGQHLAVIESAVLFSVWQINRGPNAVIQQDKELNQRLVIDRLFTFELVTSTSYSAHPVSKHKDCNGENIHFKASKSDQWRRIWQQVGGLSGPQMVLLGIPTLTDIIQSQKYKKLSQQSVCSNLKPDPFAHRDYIHEVTATLTKNSTMIQKQYILLAAMWLSQACFDYVYVSRIKRRVSSMNLFYCVHPPMLVSHTANTKILPWHDSQQCL